MAEVLKLSDILVVSFHSIEFLKYIKEKTVILYIFNPKEKNIFW